MINEMSFLKEVQKDLLRDNWREEYSYINRIIEELEWQNLTSEAKNEQRKAAFSMAQKWSNDPFLNGKKPEDEKYLDYPNALIEVYEITRELLKKLFSHTTSNHLERIKALLLIENKFLDEHILPKRHVPVQLFEIVISSIQDDGLKSEILEFISSYRNLMSLWPQNPNRSQDRL